MKRQTPQYSLASVKKAVRSGNVAPQLGKVGRDIAKLKYSPDDVKNCLLSLEESNFNDCSPLTLRSNKPGMSKEVLGDSYLVNFKVREETVDKDKLYVKFRVYGNWLHLHSFHPQTK